ncbi:hypothetical protein [Sporisorium scitamineum]|uniref:Uncharacterized protein n=1 Tax=Sporisorium scitamineum TaxID=49012 RepID=A0A0F7SD31_9BASI|nr:hypothetical protein [Sporisorium scitamineum]
MTTLASATPADAAPQARHSASPSTSSMSGAASPVGPSSSSRPPRTRFDATQLQPHLTSTLASRLRNATWDKSDKEKNRALSRSIAEVIKSKMLEIEPKGTVWTAMGQQRQWYNSSPCLF